MNKGSHFNGQPAYGQLINLLDKSKILQISQEKGGERYVKHFDAWQHLLIMLYAVIKRFDSLREITDSMFPEARKLAHLGISMMPRRSTLSDANARRSEGIFEAIYRDLYKTYRNVTFIGQPKQSIFQLDKPAADYRFDDNQPVLQPYLHGSRTPSEDGEEERRHKGPHQYPCKRGSFFRYQVHICRH